MLQTRIRRIFIRRACQSSHGSMVCRFVPWRYPCSVASDKTRTQSARDGICGTWPLCSDLKPKANNHITWCGFPSAGNLVLTSDRFVASCTQGSPLGVVVRLAIRQSLVIEEGTSLKLLPAILQKKHRTMHLKKITWTNFTYDKNVFSTKTKFSKCSIEKRSPFFPFELISERVNT